MFNDVGGQHGKPYHPGDGKYVFNKRPTIFFIVECVDFFCLWGGGGGGGLAVRVRTHLLLIGVDP